MALLTNSLLGNISGMYGGDFVFKTIRGRTFITRRPRPSSKPETKPQQLTRTRFKEATAFAKTSMLDAERKAYYKLKARQLGLPNAYTAALTDYMRTPTMAVTPDKHTGTAIVEIKKKNFRVKQVVVKQGAVTLPVITRQHGDSLFITLDAAIALLPLQMTVEDETGKWCCIDYEGVGYE